MRDCLNKPFESLSHLPNKINFVKLFAVPEREGVRRKPDGRVSLLPCGEGGERSETDEGSFVLYKFEIKRFKLYFFKV